jgi:hypothetical protein
VPVVESKMVGDPPPVVVVVLLVVVDVVDDVVVLDVELVVVDVVELVVLDVVDVVVAGALEVVVLDVVDVVVEEVDVEDVELVVVELVDVVVVVGFSRSAMNPSTHVLPSTTASRVASFPVGGRQSLFALFSALPKQLFSGSLLPLYFAFALSMQPLKFGSGSFPMVCAFCQHLRMLLSFLATHFFLLTPHFVWSMLPGSMPATSAATQLSTAVSAEAVSSKLRQSFGTLFSSFSKHPFVGSGVPSNLFSALVTQSEAFGSASLPGVSAFW